MNDLTEKSATVAKQLIARGDTVAVAESSTAGLISAALLAVPGASAYYRGGSVVYTLEARKKLIGITRQDVEGLEPLTEAMAGRFAEIAREQLGATWGISELGVAGPTGARYGHPPGISVIAIDGPVKRATMLETGSADRQANMWAFTDRAIALLGEALSAAT